MFEVSEVSTEDDNYWVRVKGNTLYHRWMHLVDGKWICAQKKRESAKAVPQSCSYYQDKDENAHDVFIYPTYDSLHFGVDKLSNVIVQQILWTGSIQFGLIHGQTLHCFDIHKNGWVPLQCEGERFFSKFYPRYYVVSFIKHVNTHYNN